MKFDRNTVLGFILLGVLFVGYFIYTSKGSKEAQRKDAEARQKQQVYDDSVKLAHKPYDDSVAHANDSIAKITHPNIFQHLGDTTEKTVSVENNLIRVTFTNKGGQIKKVELKKYKGIDSNWVRIGGTDFDKISYTINTGKAQNAGFSNSSDLFFDRFDSVTNADGSKKISYTLSSQDSSGNTITHEFTLKKDDYLIDLNIKA